MRSVQAPHRIATQSCRSSSAYRRQKAWPRLLKSQTTGGAPPGQITFSEQKLQRPCKHCLRFINALENLPMVNRRYGWRLQTLPGRKAGAPQVAESVLLPAQKSRDVEMIVFRDWRTRHV